MGTAPRLALNWGVDGEVRVRIEPARGVALWISLGVRALLPGPALGAADVPALAGVAGLGFSVDPVAR